MLIRALLLAVLMAVPAAAAPTVVDVEAVGTAFRATLSDGSVRQGAELVGAVLVLDVDGTIMRVRIASIIEESRDKTATVLLHDFRIEGTNESLCTAAPDGTKLGFPLAGLTAPDGRLVESERGTFELICTSGAQGKCVRLGYHPWQIAADGWPMRNRYNACVHLLRADYCGDSRGWTRDGTLVDLWDDLGIQTLDAGGDPAFSFEAGWRSDGAVCVAHSRIPEVITLEQLKAYCPRSCSTVRASPRSAGLPRRSSTRQDMQNHGSARKLSDGGE